VNLRSMRLAALITVAALGAGACQATGSSTDWSAAADAGQAKTEATSYGTYGMPDDWANYGGSISDFCAKNGFDCNKNRSLGEDMSSAEEIAAFDAEKNAPKAIVADIGIQFAVPADQKGVLPNFLPANASNLDPIYKGANGGWIATFVGVPGFVVNTDFLKSKNIAVPATWADLAKADYKGLVGFGKPGSSGTATTSFIAMNLAAGGTLDDYTKGIAYAKQLIQNLASSEGNADSFEKGEVPIQIKYDFNLIALANQMKAKNVGAQVVIPSDGSIYAPSALIINKYDTAHINFGKMFTDWVLSDEGQTVFAKFGARPIRAVTGDLTLPADATAGWLPDSNYANVQKVDLTKVPIEKIADIWQNQVGAAG
jgi:putative spermidine/putrescine transport system substrate-binding protein